MTDTETKAGLTLTPTEKVVTVTNRPVLDVDFAQFRAKLSGSVRCMGESLTLSFVVVSL